MREELKADDFDISPSTWLRWHRDKDEVRNAKRHRAENKSHRPSDNPILFSFKKEVAEKVDFWSTKVSVSVPSVQRACKEVREKLEFKYEKCLEKLQFSTTFCTDLMYQFNFKLSSGESDQKAFSKEEIDEMRTNLQREIENMCKEFEIPASQVLNTDESQIQPLKQNKNSFKKKWPLFQIRRRKVAIYIFTNYFVQRFNFGQVSSSFYHKV